MANILTFAIAQLAVDTPNQDEQGQEPPELQQRVRYAFVRDHNNAYVLVRPRVQTDVVFQEHLQDRRRRATAAEAAAILYNARQRSRASVAESHQALGGRAATNYPPRQRLSRRQRAMDTMSAVSGNSGMRWVSTADAAAGRSSSAAVQRAIDESASIRRTASRRRREGSAISTASGSSEVQERSRRGTATRWPSVASVRTFGTVGNDAHTPVRSSSRSEVDHTGAPSPRSPEISTPETFTARLKRKSSQTWNRARRRSTLSSITPKRIAHSLRSKRSTFSLRSSGTRHTLSTARASTALKLRRSTTWMRGRSVAPRNTEGTETAQPSSRLTERWREFMRPAARSTRRRRRGSWNESTDVGELGDALDFAF